MLFKQLLYILAYLSHAGNVFQWSVITFLILFVLAMLLVIVGIYFIKRKVTRYAVHCACATKLNVMLFIADNGKDNIQRKLSGLHSLM